MGWPLLRMCQAELFVPILSDSGCPRHTWEVRSLQTQQPMVAYKVYSDKSYCSWSFIPRYGHIPNGSYIVPWQITLEGVCVSQSVLTTGVSISLTVKDTTSLEVWALAIYRAVSMHVRCPKRAQAGFIVTFPGGFSSRKWLGQKTLHWLFV